MTYIFPETPNRTLREAELEYGFINWLQDDCKYTVRNDITDLNALEKNFRQKFEALNKVNLSDNEFKKLRNSVVSADVFAASKLLRNQNTFIRDDGTALHYSLVNLKEWCKNDFEVINQLRINTRSSHHRYDVMLLINGVPMVQIELKNSGISPKLAMEQIVRYKYDEGNGYSNSILCFIQLFIVSNQTNTYYFANNNLKHFQFSAEEKFLPIYQFADEDNKKITHLQEFSKQFLAKCTLAEMISRYMVLVETEQQILVMRPYQIYAVKHIVKCIEENRGNGFIWHTTGSGKTLTSFKASTLLKDNPKVDKCLFVVDRKDLDVQTRLEFNKFQPNCVEENTNTEALVKRLLSDDYADKVIVTTIQKLGVALDSTNKNNYRELLQTLGKKRIAFIFDECHRSQFGDNHQAIKEFFPNAQLFGFTGTPIFNDNASYTRIDDGVNASLATTEGIFKTLLHKYTISHAIDDRNVLRFNIDYYKPDDSSIQPGDAIAKKAIVEAILQKHEIATNHGKFNAVLATQSISDAIEYYRLFNDLQAEKEAADPTFQKLNITAVFSPPVAAIPDAAARNQISQIQEDLVNEVEDNKVDPEGKKKALQEILTNYNTKFGTNHTLNEFDAYYQDVQTRIKNQKWDVKDFPKEKRLDITIVVDMLLTGFDSKYLNTLYVDKKLKYHGLIQAFSRTNRVLNDSKPHGNILDFRQQMAAVDEAIKLFSGMKEEEAKEIWLVKPAPVIMVEYKAAFEKLAHYMAAQQLPATPDAVHQLQGDSAKEGFINSFKEVQKLKNQLEQYTDLTPEIKAEIETIIPPENLRAFRGAYLEIAKQLRPTKQSSENPNTIGQQLDFEFVLFASAIIDFDYIMGLVAGLTNGKPSKEKMTAEQIISLLKSTANLMDEEEDLVNYIENLDTTRGYTQEEITENYKAFKKQNYQNELQAIANAHNLDLATLAAFIRRTLELQRFDAPDFMDTVLAPLDLGWREKPAKVEELKFILAPIIQSQADGRYIEHL